MPTFLDIHNQVGPVETRKLSKRQPITFGRHSSNDVCIDEEDVGLMHCRISWNNGTYEVVAAGADGVDVNGTVVRNAPLQSGGMLRIGTFDVSVRHEPSQSVEPKQSKPAHKSPRKQPDANSEKAEEFIASSDVLAAFSDPNADVFEEEPEEEDASSTGKPKAKGAVGALKSRLMPRPVRPGEQDLLRSPLVMWLGGGSLVLLLGAATFWFVIGRESAKRHYEAAISEMEQGKYTQAIQIFEEFLKEYPNNKYTGDARIGLGKAKVEQEISGSKAKWPEGLAAVDQFIRQNRDRDGFSELQADLRGYAKRITLGAAKSAELATDPKLLAVSTEAETMLKRFSPDGLTPEVQQEIKTAYRKAEAAIRKQDVFDADVAEIEKLIKSKPPKPVAALGVWKRLTIRYPELQTHRKMRDLLKQALETENKLVVREDLNKVAIHEERPSPLELPLSLTVHNYSSTDLSTGRIVIALAKDCCYGADATTGEPLWRRVIGSGPPFFPIRVSVPAEGWLVFDTNHRELILIQAQTGIAVWRQPIGENATGAPLLFGGQIYLPTTANRLYRIEQKTGKVTARLQFSQQLVASPELVSGQDQLVVMGDDAVLYTLSLRPLACVAVSHLGHQAGSVEAPLIKLGKLLLMSENDRIDSCRLRVLGQREDDRWRELDAKRLSAQVRDAPVIRRNQLFVPTSDQRITAFTVSDDKSRTPLIEAAAYDLQDPYRGPTFLRVGPDGQFWMAGSALRKFRLETDSITMTPAQAAVGLSTQPLQMINQQLYVGRRLPHSRAVILTQTDRNSMLTPWGTVLGASILRLHTPGDGSGVCVTENGAVFRFSTTQLQKGGLRKEATRQIGLPQKLVDPLHASDLGNGQIAVYCGTPKPTLWMIDSAARVSTPIHLDQPLQANPVALAAGIVLPLPGKLRLVPRNASSSSDGDYFAADKPSEEVRWTQLAALTEDTLLVLDSRGTLAKIQWDVSTRALIPASEPVKLDHPADVAMLVADGKIFLADSAQRLRVFSAANLEPIAEEELDGPASNALWFQEGKLFVETGSKRLTCFDTEPDFRPLWSVSLKGNRAAKAGVDHLAGAPVIIGSVVVAAKSNGEILAIDLNDGSLRRRLHLGQHLTDGPHKAGEFLVVPSIDGSLHRIESILKNSE